MRGYNESWVNAACNRFNTVTQEGCLNLKKRETAQNNGPIQLWVKILKNKITQKQK